MRDTYPLTFIRQYDDSQLPELVTRDSRLRTWHQRQQRQAAINATACHRCGITRELAAVMGKAAPVLKHGHCKSCARALRNKGGRNHHVKRDEQ